MTSSHDGLLTADAARDAIAFVSAVHRGDSEAVKVIFDNSDLFDLPHLIARYFIDFMRTIAATSSDTRNPDDQVREFLVHLQAEQRKSC